MMNPYIGMIIMFGGNFAIRDWALCQGQILSIAQNTALFSLLGTTYGGNGQTTFALPDLRGRVPIGWGQGPGLPTYDLGQVGGTETVTLTANQMPAHSHPLSGSSLAGNASLPTGAVPANSGPLDKEYSTVFTSNVAMVPTGIAGGSQPFPIRDPYLCLNFQIALAGIFPSRN
ncbi:MAG: phage tail protein [Sphingobacteriaceae bacterium]|nr:MAG: phage tail protein [Sphingobacteriaceae bacterium]